MKPTAQQLNRILVRDYNAGYSVDKLAFIHKMTAHTIRKRLVECGVTIRGRQEPNPIPDDVVERYRNGESMTQLVKNCHSNWYRIKGYLEENGVEIT